MNVGDKTLKDYHYIDLDDSKEDTKSKNETRRKTEKDNFLTIYINKNRTLEEDDLEFQEYADKQERQTNRFAISNHSVTEVKNR